MTDCTNYSISAYRHLIVVYVSVISNNGYANDMLISPRELIPR